MKNTIHKTALIILLAFLSSFTLVAQVPEGIVYQAEARDQNGKILQNKFLEVEVNILQGSANGAFVWQGIHEIHTDKYGLITLTIGEGASSHNFSLIDWAHYAHFLNVRINDKGNWTDLGTMQFISVPYAIHSQTTEHAFNADEIDPFFNAWDKSTGITLTENQILDLTHFTTEDEIDPVFSNSEAANITTNEITNLSNLSGVNTGDQDLSLSDNTLALSGDASSVDLSSYMDNTDVQQLSIEGNVLSLDNSADVVLNLNDADADPTNELQDLTVLAEKSNVLELDNTTEFTPDADYEPATKKYVDDYEREGFLPPQMTSAEREAISAPATGLMIYNTDENNWQGFNGFVWVNIDGSSCIPDTPGTINGNKRVEDNATDEVYSITAVEGASSYNWTVPEGATITAGQNSKSITVNFGTSSGIVSVRAENGCGNSTYTNLSVITGLAIGDSYEGGIIFYIDGTRQHGLILAPFVSSAYWGCIGTEISGADGTTIGAGAQNTQDIEAGCTSSGTAALICANLSLNGYDDWFLPSKDELNALYLAKSTFGSFLDREYWSSTEYNSSSAWCQNLEWGNQGYCDKDMYCVVCPIRAF